MAEYSIGNWHTLPRIVDDTLEKQGSLKSCGTEVLTHYFHRCNSVHFIFLYPNQAGTHALGFPFKDFDRVPANCRTIKCISFLHALATCACLL